MNHISASSVAQRQAIGTTAPWSKMVFYVRSPLVWLIVTLILSLLAFSVTVYNAFPHIDRTPLDATLLGLLDSAVFLFIVAISSVYVVLRREIGAAVRIVLCLLLAAGILWSIFLILYLSL